MSRTDLTIALFGAVFLLCLESRASGAWTNSRSQSVGDLAESVRQTTLQQILGAQAVIRVGVQPDLADAGLFVSEQGALAEAGLGLEVRVLGWGEIMDSLSAGGLDVGLISPVAHLSARAMGHDLRVIAAGTAEEGSAPTRRLVVPPGSAIQRPADLVDRWVGVLSQGSPDHLMLQAWLGRQGVDPGRVHFAELSLPLLVGALVEGRLDAALMPEPYLSGLVERGARALDSPYSDLTKEPTPLSYFVAEASWLSSHGDVARRFAAMLHRTHAALQADPAAYRAATARRLGRDPAIVDRIALPILQTQVTPAQVQAWADLFPQPAAASPARLAPTPSDLLFDSVR